MGLAVPALTATPWTNLRFRSHLLALQTTLLSALSIKTTLTFQPKKLGNLYSSDFVPCDFYPSLLLTSVMSFFNGGTFRILLDVVVLDL